MHRICKCEILVWCSCLGLLSLFMGCGTANRDIYEEAALLGTADFREMIGEALCFPDIAKKRIEIYERYSPEEADGYREYSVDPFTERIKDERPYVQAMLPSISRQLASMGVQTGESVEDYICARAGYVITKSWTHIGYYATDNAEPSPELPNGPILTIRPDMDEALRTLYIVCHLIADKRMEEAKAMFNPERRSSFLADHAVFAGCDCEQCCDIGVGKDCKRESGEDFGLFLGTFRKHWEADQELSKGLFRVIPAVHSFPMIKQGVDYPREKRVHHFRAYGHLWNLYYEPGIGRWLVWLVAGA